MKKERIERILIFTDTHKQSDLDNAVEAVQQAANELITIFESFQSYKKIKSLDDFETLVTGPLTMFDEALQVNVSFQESGGKKGNPEVIAKLFDIDRTSYQAIIKGEKIIEGSCKTCSKLKIKQTGKGFLNYASFKKYQEYLLFDQGRFSINENAVSEKKLSFQVFAETPEQIRVWNHWQNLCNMLNDHAKKNYIGSDTLDKIPGLFKNRLTFSYQAGELALDMQSLLFEIQNTKN